MWARGIAGLVLVLLGALWVLQGVNVVHGSGMSGHGQFAVLGVVTIVLGLALLVWAARVRRRQPVDSN
jgi:protein-S-isoprenylcysteine O-methyltransferase Ste14